MRFAVVVVLVVASSLVTSNAIAGVADKAAERQLARAKKLMDRQQIDLALAACRRAYGLRSNPRYILWLARIYARGNRMKEARKALRTYRLLRRQPRQKPSKVAKRRRARFTASPARGVDRSPRLSDIFLPGELVGKKRKLWKRGRAAQVSGRKANVRVR